MKKRDARDQYLVETEPTTNQTSLPKSASPIKQVQNDAISHEECPDCETLSDVDETGFCMTKTIVIDGVCFTNANPTGGRVDACISNVTCQSTPCNIKTEVFGKTRDICVVMNNWTVTIEAFLQADFYNAKNELIVLSSRETFAFNNLFISTEEVCPEISVDDVIIEMNDLDQNSGDTNFQATVTVRIPEC